jgi:gliding motility-associated-like protein
MPATAPYSPYVSKFKPNGTHLWTKYLEYPTYDLSQTMAKATPDGGFVIFSKFLIFNNLGVIDSFLYRLNKFDLNGNLIWGKLIHREVAGGSQKIDLQVAADGSIFVNASFVSKIDPSGNEIWSTDFTEFNLIRITPDGGLIGILPASNIHLIIKLKPDGTPDWASSFPASNFQLKDAIATPDGDIYILGQLSVLPVGVIHGALIRLNAVGQTIWAKSYRQIPVSSYFFSALNTGDNGDLIVAGDAKVDDPGMGPLKDYHILMSIDTNGVVMWNRHFLENLNMETVTKIPGAGFCMTAAKGWIFRVNELGNTQNCPGTPKNITVTDIPISTTDIQTNLPSFTPQFADEPLALTPVSASLDTLCAPSCLISVEICNNNLDDDGDGLFDCLDTQCNCEEERCASKTGNLWYFGDKSGLDFSTSPPTLLGNGQSSTTSNSATICDAKGNLLLYTDGKQIYNRFHQPMPNANILVGSLVFDVMIIPHPGQTGQYYVLANYDGGKTYYSLVDLTLDDGKGDVVPGQKNLLLVLDVQGMAAIKSCAFNGYWFVTRKFDVQGTFVSFRIDESGINNSPVFSPTNQPVGLVRQLKISPDGQQIACTYYINSVFDSSALSIYRFDPYSGGTITNPQLLGKFKDPFRAYGVEFSPNSRYLYASGTFPGNFQLVQYDLQGGNTQTIISSRIGISKLPGQTIAFLQLGPDHKIYAPTYSFFQPTAYFLDVIHKPNNAGLDCQFEHESLGITAFFPNGTAKDGTCNVIASILAQPEINLSPAAPDTICALGTPKLYELLSFSCGIDSITWTVAGLGAQIQPNFQSATIRYLNYGNGKLIVKAFSSCGNLSDTLDIWVIAPPSTPLNLGPDLEVCDNGVFTFNAGSGFTRYQWSDGSTDSTTTTLFPGVYWVNVWDACGNLQTDTIKVSIQQVSVLNVGTDLPQQCSGFSKTYTLPAGFSSWSWSPNQYLNCSNCPEVTISPETSTNWVVVAQTSEGCISVDTLQALIRDTLLFQLDTFVCQNEALIIFDSLLAPNSTTQFFQPAGSVGCDTLWTVNVAVREASSTAFSVTICNNETFLYLEEHLEPETITTFQFTNAVGCDSMVYITVNSFPSLTLSLPMDTSIRIGDAVALDAVATGSPTLNFSWSPPDGLSCLNCPDPVANPLDTITYTLEVTDANGCVMEKSVQVRVINECDIQVPNAFTPNGDGANDVFRPVLDPCVHTVTLWRVVNRWGQTVFEQYNIPAEDIQLGWDGQRNGEPHPSDVLIWMAEYELYNGERKIESGQVTLSR